MLSPIRRTLARIRGLFRRARLQSEQDEEFRLHIDMQAEHNEHLGMSPEEARRAAVLAFGGVQNFHEETRDARGMPFLEQLSRDVRFAFRHFARKPLTAATSIVVLAIGIGVHAGVFSLIQALTLRAAPGVPRDGALVAIRGKERLNREARWRSRAFSYPELRDLAAQRDIFASVAGWVSAFVALDLAEGESRDGSVQFVTDGFFSTLGVHPGLGAGLPATDRAAPGDAQLVAIIGHALWRQRYGLATDAVGSIIRVNDVPVRIVGVAPPRFNGAVSTHSTRTLWMPLSARAMILATTAHAMASRDSAMLTAVARLQPEVKLARASAAVAVIGARPAGPVPADSATRTADVVALRAKIGLYAEKEAVLTAATWEALALLILLITCTNVSALMVGAAVARRPEIAIRLALGASRARLVRQLLTESSLLAVAGGTLGLLVYWWLSGLLAVQLPETDVTPDLMTVAATLTLALGTGILFGLSPALHATRQSAADALKDTAAGATSRSRLQRVMVVAQIALTQPLLLGLGVTAAVVLQEAGRATNADLADRVINVAFALSDRRAFREGELEDVLRGDATRSQLVQIDEALRRVAALPGVFGVVRGTLGTSPLDLQVIPEDQGPLPAAAAPVDVQVESPGPGYFALMELPILYGRALVAADTLEAEIPMVIGSELARELWGRPDVIGKRFEQRRAQGRGQRYVVAGVVDSERDRARGAEPVVYTPLISGAAIAYVIRTTGPAAPVMASLRAIVHTEIPRSPILLLETLGERQRTIRAESLAAGGAAGSAGLLALLLASIGLHGVVALALGQRRREIGVRVALGARPQQVVRMLFGSGLKLSLLGLTLGLPLSAVAMQVAKTRLGLAGVNIALLGAAIALLVIAVASLATWIPARHAARVDVMETLRAE
jgi:predicted permease